MAAWRLATVTLNCTLDRVLVAPGLSLGQIRDADTALTLAGGKGLNVARTASALGADVAATGLVAGQCGQWICSCLDETQVTNRLIRLPEGESRTSTIIVDPISKQTTVMHDLGPTVRASQWPELFCALCANIAGYPWVALAGSSLPGVPDSVYAQLCLDLQTRGQHVCLDTRGRWLELALSARPYLLKCNQYEAADILGFPIDTPDDARHAARHWVTMGLERIVISLGSLGAVAADREQQWFIAAPHVDALCPVGSGDAMMAGIIAGLTRGDPLPLAAQYGVALGSANTLVFGAGRCDLGAMPELVRGTNIHVL